MSGWLFLKHVPPKGSVPGLSEPWGYRRANKRIRPNSTRARDSLRLSAVARECKRLSSIGRLHLRLVAADATMHSSRSPFVREARPMIVCGHVHQPLCIGFSMIEIGAAQMLFADVDQRGRRCLYRSQLLAGAAEHAGGFPAQPRHASLPEAPRASKKSLDRSPVLQP